MDFINNVIERFGYFGVGFLIALENIFPPIPSEVILTLGGYLSVTEGLSLVIMTVCATAGSVAGALALYLIGKLIGFEKLHNFAEKHGKWLGVRGESLERANAFYSKHQTISVLIFRLVPLMRSLISIPAGINRMNLPSFTLLTALGSLIWNTVLILLGAFLGENREIVLQYFHVYSYVVYALLGALVAGIIVWRIVKAVKIKTLREKRSVKSVKSIYKPTKSPK